MGVRFPSVNSNTFIGPFPPSAAETICLTTPPISPPLDNTPVIVQWFAVITAGASVTGFAMRIRRGATAVGVVVGLGAFSQSMIAAQTQIMSGFYVDNPGTVGGQQYTLTCVSSAATGASSWVDGNLLAFCL